MKANISIGSVYNKLTVTSEPFKRSGKFYLTVKCKCGSLKDIRIDTFGKSISCGCYRKETASANSSKHGLWKHPLFRVWSSMKERCLTSSHKSFNNYGGRGILVWIEWQNDFKCFYDWAMSNGYKKGLQLDRIDNNGNYQPSNCRFTNHVTNSQNRRTSKLDINKANEIRCLSKSGVSRKKIADTFGVSYGTITHVLNNNTWL